MLTGSQAPRGVLSAASFPGLLITFDYPEKRVELRTGELPPQMAKPFLHGTRAIPCRLCPSP